jgi:flagellar motor switch protein FliM
MPHAQGALHLCLPAVVLNTILRKVSTERDRPRRRSPESRSRLTELLGEAKFGAVMQLPKVRLRADELANLAVGSVLRLPLPAHANGELRIGGLPVFVAHAARAGEHRAAQVQSHAAASERGER